MRRWPLSSKRFLPWLILALLLSLPLLLDTLFPLPRYRLFPPSSLQIYADNGELARVFLTPDQKVRLRVRLDEVPPTLLRTFLLSEDRFFLFHQGFNPLAILRALWENLRRGETVSGASTLTMQIARMMEPKPRTLPSKAIEALRALQLELHYSKAELLEIYVNLLPYGSNVEGIGAACRLYFGKPLSALTPGEMALLAVIPRAPERFGPHRREGRLRERSWRSLLRRLHRQRALSKQGLDEAGALQDNLRRRPLPFLLPHASEWVKRTFPGKDRLYTTLSLSVQRLVEGLALQERNSLERRGIRNIAIVVLENRTMEIKALVGSQDYLSPQGGQVNGFLALRSPGSTLKPFLYAYALERGMITTETLLRDIPTDFGEYAPENFDAQYHGLVPAGEALAQSLNVPAVILQQRVGVAPFLALLKNSGLDSLREPKEYGLSLVLGGCGLSLLELTKAYSLFPLGGVSSSFRILQGEPVYRKRVFQPGTAYLISEILSRHNRPDFPSQWQETSDLVKVSWKTGTSYGRFDAWSIGFTPDYTVGVWVGNFDNRSSPDIVGSDAATPLLFRILSPLSRAGGHRWFQRPADLIPLEVCAFSGMVPKYEEEPTKRVWVLKNRVPVETCTYHRRYFLDPSGPYRSCPEKMDPAKEYPERVGLAFPPDLAFWFQRRGILPDLIPPLAPGCLSSPQSSQPQILFPRNGQAFLLRSEGKGRERIPFRSDRKLHWFLDGLYLGQGWLFPFTPSPGEHRLQGVDEEGVDSEELLFRVTFGD